LASSYEAGQLHAASVNKFKQIIATGLHVASIQFAGN
jgi:hypothetical protein